MEQTDSCQRGGEVDRMKETEGISQEHICTTHSNRQQLVMARGKVG